MGGRAWAPPWDKGSCGPRKRSGRPVAKLSSFAYLPNITYDTLSVREAGAPSKSRRRSACLAFHNMRGSATK